MSGRDRGPGGGSPPGVRARLAAAVVVMAVAGCGGSGPPAVPTGSSGQPDPVLEAGRRVYAVRCANCHGGDGGGGRGAKLSDGRAAARYPDLGAMTAVIAEGRGSGMPSFDDTLDPDEIEAVARYVREVLS